MTSKAFSLPFIKKEQVAQGVSSFYFDRKNIDYDFFPGQYNRVSLPITPTDGRGTSRFFTIASSPLEKDILMITTKEGRSDFKKKLFTLQTGELVHFFGPLGGFVFDETDPGERVFLAGGIGITPFHSMTIYAAEKNLPIPITLFVSFSIPEEMVYYNELTAITKEHENIKVIYTITHPEQSQKSWSGEKGRISEALIKKYVADISRPIFSIVGPPAMVDGTEELLENMGIANEKIKVEQFTGY